MDLLPDPEAMGLLALMLLQESRRAARTTPEGDLILLDDQDRSLWDRAKIAEARPLVERAIASQRFGVYTMQAALAGDDDSFAYLRGQATTASVGGIRIHQAPDDHVARGHIDSLVNTIGATGGTLFLAFDQLEQSRVEGWEQRLRHLFSRGALLAETLPLMAKFGTPIVANVAGGDARVADEHDCLKVLRRCLIMQYRSAT